MVRDEKMLIKQSVKTLSIGIFMALLFSCVYTLSIPIEEVTDEMRGRLNPNLLDLMVAFISGIAGAYAYAKEEVAKSLAGVAIAVALVPPLSVTGIGIGYGDLGMIYGSFLLFITNLIGITLSAAITFIILGYSPIAKAKKGLVYTTVLMSVITIPLIYSFGNLIQKNDYYHEIITIKSVVINEKKVDIKVIDIKNSKPVIDVEIQTTSSEPLVVDEYKEIKKLIEKKLNKKIALKVIPKIIVSD
ncbi:MAG: DUF389 domain-containing protein [Campylobacterales bacterium]|nr:DUF389 domain-containing protein [Campylobacterales bacterium]